MKYLWRVLIVVFCILIVLGFAYMGRLMPQRENTFSLKAVQPWIWSMN